MGLNWSKTGHRMFLEMFYFRLKLIQTFLYFWFIPLNFYQINSTEFGGSIKYMHKTTGHEGNIEVLKKTLSNLRDIRVFDAETQTGLCNLYKKHLTFCDFLLRYCHFKFISSYHINQSFSVICGPRLNVSQ